MRGIDRDLDEDIECLEARLRHRDWKTTDLVDVNKGNNGRTEAGMTVVDDHLGSHLSCSIVINTYK